MGSPETSNRQQPRSSRRHSRSPSTDSEEERRRRRRRREREADRGSARSDRHDDRSRGTRDRHEDKVRYRRRSRSPVDSNSTRQKDDRDSYRRRSRSPRRKDDRGSHRRRRDRSRDRRRIDDDENDDRDSSRSAEPHMKSVASRKQDGPLPSQAASFQSKKDASSTTLATAANDPVPEKERPNLGQTGILAAASNTITQADGNSIVLKYHEPPEASKPPAKDDWKLFVFKGADIIETIDLSAKSCWLVGRELAVVDLAAEHPSISKQHAVIQFKASEKMNEFGDKVRKVKPYLIDLESANGTMMNKDPVDSSRYVELRDKDMIQFGHSTREYVLMLAPRT